MKKICQTWWEKDPFKIFVNCHLHNKVFFFYPILLKLSQIVCIILRINGAKNEENRFKRMGKGPF